MHHVNVVGHQGLVAPYRGSDARYATNPYCCALPETPGHERVVLDMATTMMAHGKIRVARNKGEQLPEGVVIDGHGRPSTDPDVMFQSPQGAMMPFASYKGYGLALICELFAGVLSGGGTCRPETNREHDTILNNMLSVIIDPTRMVGQDFFDNEAAATLSHVKASPPMNSDEPVLVPGDPERATGKQRRDDGIPVDEQSWQLFTDAALAGDPPEFRSTADIYSVITGPHTDFDYAARSKPISGVRRSTQEAEMAAANTGLTTLGMPTLDLLDLLLSLIHI